MKYVLLAFYLVIHCFLLAGKRYVSPTGNNTNSGNAGSPWQTIQKAMNSALPGDTVFISPGTYNEAPVMNVSGTPGAWIVFTGISADSVFVDGTGLNADNLMTIISQGYLKVQSIHFINNVHNNAVGLFIAMSAHDIIIDSCKVSNICFSANAADTANDTTNANPLLVYGTSSVAATRITIANNEIFNCRPGYSEGLTMDGNVDSFEITGNTVHDIPNIGIVMAGHYKVSPDSATDQARNGICNHNLVYNCQSPYAACAGIYADGSLNNIIERNTVYNCQYGIEIGCETVGKTASGIIARNNFVYNNTTAGIAFGGYNYPAGSGKITGCHLLNNTTYHNDTSYNGNGELAISYAENCSIFNNILYCNTQNQLMYCQIGNAQADTFDYNCWFAPAPAGNVAFDYGGNTYNSLATYTAGTGQDVHSIFANPLFIAADTLNPDLHITPQSHCIYAGFAGPGQQAGLYDIDGNPRFTNGNIDIGAQQLSALLAVAGLSSSPGVEVFPNPAHNLLTVKTESFTNAAFISLTDITGRIVKQKLPLTGLRTTLNISNLSPGLYFYQVTGTGDEISGRGELIVQ